jgi:hypothetical protein
MLTESVDRCDGVGAMSSKLPTDDGGEELDGFRRCPMMRRLALDALGLPGEMRFGMCIARDELVLVHEDMPIADVGLVSTPLPSPNERPIDGTHRRPELSYVDESITSQLPNLVSTCTCGCHASIESIIVATPTTRMIATTYLDYLCFASNRSGIIQCHLTMQH